MRLELVAELGGGLCLGRGGHVSVGGSGAPRNAPVLTQGFSSSLLSHPTHCPSLGQPSPGCRCSRARSAGAVGTPSCCRPSPALPAAGAKSAVPAAAAGGAEALHHCSGGRAAGTPLPRSRPDGHLLAAAHASAATAPGPDWRTEGVSGFIYTTFSSRLDFIRVDGWGRRQPSLVGRRTNRAPALMGSFAPLDQPFPQALGSRAPTEWGARFGNLHGEARRAAPRKD